MYLDNNSVDKMPIKNTINEEEKIIYTSCSGIMTEDDFKEYIHNVWSHGNYYGYNELFNTTEANWDDFDFGFLLYVAQSAAKLKTIDPNSKLAWVVLEGKQQKLTDFYISAKSMLPVQSRALEAFFSRDEALAWLKTS